MALTETDIKTLKPHPDRDSWVNDGAGLYLRIVSSGRKTWVWRTKKSGRTSYFTLGEWPTLTVKQARSQLAKRTGRATPPNALAVKDALDEWFTDQVEPKYRITKNVRNYINRAGAEFGARRLQELTRVEIARFVRSYAKTSPVAANRCLSTVKLALGWCVEMGYLEHSPAEGLTRRVAGGNEESRDRVLSDAEICEIWRLDSPNVNLLRALLLTGCRVAELQKARHGHIQSDWLTIPALHSKNGRAHRVYLTPEARKQFDGTDLLFRATSRTSPQAWAYRLQIDRRDDSPREPWLRIRPNDPQTGKPIGPWTPHDLRRTFATRLGDLGIAPHVIEKLLNHTAQGVAAIYNRAELLPERIDATKRWAAEVNRIVS